VSYPNTSFVNTLIFSILMLVVFSFFFLMQKASSNVLTNDDAFNVQQSHFTSHDDYHNIEQILRSEPFIDSSTAALRYDFGTQAYWHSIEITNKSTEAKNFVLFIDNYVLYELDIFFIKNDQVVETQRLGNKYWPENLEYRTLPSTNVTIPPESTQRIVIRSFSKGAQVFPLLIFEPNDYENFKQYIYLLWGLFVGLIFIMALYNFILFTGVKDKVYLYYVGYIISMMIELGLVHGFISYLFPKIIVDILTDNVIIIHYVVSYFALNFALKFLKFENDNDNIYSIGKSISYFFIVMAFTTILMEEFEALQIFFAVQGGLYLFILFLLIRKIRKELPWAKYYFISWLPIYIGAALTPMQLVGILEHSFLIRNSLLLAVMAEATLMALALAHRLQSIEDRILFNSTHDQLINIANNSLMARRVEEFKAASDSEFTYVVVITEIQQYHSISPYLTDIQQKALVTEFALLIEDSFKKLPLLAIDQNSEQLKHTFIYKDGTTGLIIQEHEAVDLSRSLSKLESKLPLKFDSGTMLLSLNGVIGLSKSQDADNAIQAASKALQVINHVKKEEKFFGNYSKTAVEAEQRKLLLAAELQHAVESNQLELYHQPLICLQNLEPISSECLLRWNHKTLGFISPDEFIPIAEDTGLIEQVSRWVVQKAFLNFREILGVDKTQRISINLSTHDIIQNHMCSFIIECARDLSIDSEKITLEVTETSSIFDQNGFGINIELLTKAGFKIAIDDYGTGYSSMSYISTYPFSEIKIDKSLILCIASSHRDELLVKAVISMTSNLELSSVGEGIEDEETLSKLRQLKCDIGQGYHIARPMPLTEYLNWLDCKGST